LTQEKLLTGYFHGSVDLARRPGCAADIGHGLFSSVIEMGRGQGFLVLLALVGLVLAELQADRAAPNMPADTAASEEKATAGGSGTAAGRGPTASKIFLRAASRRACS
jgi:hypothetical protein